MKGFQESERTLKKEVEGLKRASSGLAGKVETLREEVEGLKKTKAELEG